ncbi:MAG: hypothetical protein M3Y79_01245 [Pseudomonadota bacterium]|nr:hypothetical protein [Pseudomonadota bacterium]
MLNRNCIWRGLFCAAACVSPSAFSMSIDVEIGAGAGYSDNFTRASEGEQDSTLASLGTRLSLLHSTRRLEANVLGDLALTHYSGNEYSSELTGNAAARLDIGLIDNRLRWQVEDTFGQTRLDLFAVPSPENLEHVNYLSTGPDLRFGLGSATSLLLGIRYARVDYQESPADSQRASAWMAAERELSTAARLSMVVSAERIEPSEAAAIADYRREAAHLRYGHTGARTTLSLGAGGNRVQGGGFDETGAMLAIELVRALSTRSRLSLKAGRELTDSGSQLQPGSVEQVASPTAGSSALTQAPEPYTHTYVDAGWAVEGRRTALELSGGWSSEEYDGVLPDRSRHTGRFSARRRVGQRTEVAATVTFNAYQFDGAGVDNEELLYNLSISHDLGRRIRLELAGDRAEYSSDGPAGEVQEMRYWLRIYYRQHLGRDAPR